MKDTRPQTPRPESREGVIVFSAAGFKFAINAAAAQEIRGLKGLRPFALGGISGKLAKLQYTLELNGTTVFVVDAARHFHLPPSQPSRLVVLCGAPVAVLVDSTDRMLEISTLHALPHAFTHDERQWYRGLAVVDNEVIPLVNHHAFLTSAEQGILSETLDRVREAAAL